MTTIKEKEVNVFGDFYERICDNCEKRMDGMPHLHWEEKDFDLCFKCLESVYSNSFPPIPKYKETSSIYRKAVIPSKLRWEIWRRDNFTCQYCGIKEELSIDHIIPESRGGKLIENNLVTACRKCNSSKGGRTPEEIGITIMNDPRK